MRSLKPILFTGGVMIAAGAMVWSTGLTPLTAADHFDPPTRTGTYSMRVQLPATLTDAASNRNALPAASRCVVSTRTRRMDPGA